MGTLSRNLFIIALGLVLGVQAWGQSVSFKRADQLYENEAYPSAAKLYAQGLKSGFDQRAAERLGKCYQNTGDLEQALVWYGQAFEKTTQAQVAWDYGQVLKSSGNYAKAAAAFDRYGELSMRYEEARVQATACEQAEKIKGDGKGWKVNPTDLNSKASDFGPVVSGGRMLFVSARNRGFFTRILNLRNDNLFYDIYAAEIKGPVNFDKAKLQRGALKTRYHDGPMTFSADQNTAYFTRSNLKKGKLKRDQQDRAHLQLYAARLSRGKYRDAQLLPFNGDGYSTGHPALLPGDNAMVFASDMPGGLGGTDLYISQREGNGWSKPRNLGPEVNTAGDELFPSIVGGGMLVFSSDGQPGLGGLDIFLASPLPDGNWGKVQNPGSPLNSARDDFGVYWSKGGKGYFSSNRPGGKGEDDIYQFSRVIPLNIEVVSQSGLPVVDAEVLVRSASGGVTPLKTDASGLAHTYIDWNQSYRLEANREGYRPMEQMLEFDPEQSIGGRAAKLELYKFPVARVDGEVSSSEGGYLDGASAKMVGEGRDFPFATDAKGKFAGAVDTNSLYTAVVTKAGYLPGISEFDTKGMTEDKTVPLWFSLKPGSYLLLEGVTLDKATGARLAGTQLRAISDNDSLVSGPARSRADGRFWLGISRKVDSDVLASREGYFTARVDLPPLTGLKADSTASVTVELVPAKVGEIVKIIYYGYREATLTQKAKNSLDEIVFFLLDNPKAVVELSAHTDSRGSDAFNLTLSEARAQAAVDYVISRGVKKDRIVAKGYGRSQLANDCVEGKECTDEQHGLNRRCEIKVIAISEGGK